MNNFQEIFVNKIIGGLTKNSVRSPSKWAEMYRVMPEGPWSFKHYPWLKEMHDSKAERNVGQKAAQVGYTEWALNRTLYNIDVNNFNCLYVLPAKSPDAKDFSSGRFDTALELSEHIGNMFSDVKNIGHKRAGAANLYIRGSKSRAGLKSIPASYLVLDELDEMNQKNVTLAFERTSGQKVKCIDLISTPTIANKGINKYFEDSTKEEFFFICPGCKRFITLTFPESFVIIGEGLDDPRIEESYIQCDKCKIKLEHEEKYKYFATGVWVPAKENADKNKRGFHINQLYSPTITPKVFVETYFAAMVDPAREQEFYNSKLGLPHTVKDASVEEKHITACIKNYKNGFPLIDINTNIVTLGCDVGKKLHYVVEAWSLDEMINNFNDINLMAQCHSVKVGTLNDFEDLDLLMNQFKVNFAVIDANPENRKSLEFCRRFYGIAKMCYYVQGVQGKQINVWKDEEAAISINRTSWLDLALNRFRVGKIDLPSNIPYEYREHIKSLVKWYEVNEKDGVTYAKYIAQGDDHFAHARNYSEIAFSFALTLNKSYDIVSV